MMTRYMTKKNTETLISADSCSSCWTPRAATMVTGCSMVSTSAATTPRWASCSRMRTWRSASALRGHNGPGLQHGIDFGGHDAAMGELLADEDLAQCVGQRVLDRGLG